MTTIAPLFYTKNAVFVYEALNLTPSEISEWEIGSAYTQIVATPLLREITILDQPSSKMTVGDDYTLTWKRTPYYADEAINFSYSGSGVTATAIDSTSATIHANASGTTTVTMTGEMGTATRSFTVDVHNISQIDFYSIPKHIYTLGEPFTSEGLVLNVFFDDDTNEIVSSGFTVTPPDMTIIGIQSVTVTYKGRTTAYQIQINPPGAESITLNAPTNDIFVGDTYQLTWSFSPQSSSESVSFTSSDNSILTVNNDGLLTAHKMGTASVTITSQSSLTDTISITVKGDESFSVSPKNISIYVGQTQTIQYELHTYHSNVTISFSSSNSNIASVSGFIITGVNVGNATITFSTTIGLSDTVQVTVLEQSDGDDDPSGDSQQGDDDPNDGQDGVPDGEQPDDGGNQPSDEPESGDGQTPGKGSDNGSDTKKKEQENMTVGIVAGAVAISIVGGTVGTIVGVTIHKKKKRKASK